jgi:hypothetical protein
MGRRRHRAGPSVSRLPDALHKRRLSGNVNEVRREGALAGAAQKAAVVGFATMILKSVTPLRRVQCLRYVTPLREGGSLPAIVEADDDGMYVVKFHGAGQGPKALVAELIAAGIGHALGLPVPETVLVELDPALGVAEPDPEIQDLLERSAGLNVGLDYLPGSLPLGAPEGSGVSPELAADVIWFDAFLSNVDRTPRNPNLLLWHRNLWLIDHGAALYTQHRWSDDLEAIAASAGARFPVIRDHVLLPIAGSILAADERLTRRLTADIIEDVVAAIPDELLEDVSPFSTPERHREAYLTHLTRRIAAPRRWVEEAEEARLAAD